MNRFTVIGKFPFPLDMLRYDSCYPTDTDSTFQIADSITERDLDSVYKVNLRGKGPTKGRWQSFGWKVE